MVSEMKKVIFIANDFDIVIYRFRKEVLNAFIHNGLEVGLCTPYSDNAIKFCKDNNIKYYPLKVDRRGKNPFADLRLLFTYFKIIKKEKPDFIFSYTIKPNLYVGLVNRIFKKKFYPNVTGLGSVFTKQNTMQKIVTLLYRLSFKSATKVFFQNESNKKLFLDKKIIVENKSILLPGSGVNLQEKKFCEYPIDDGQIRFLFLGRIMKEKGVFELIEAFKLLNKIYVNIELDFYGFCEMQESGFKNAISTLSNVEYCGFTNDSAITISKYHAIIQPSYEGYEGLSNSLLEAAALGRPIITNNVCGCCEIVENNITGFLAKEKDVDTLVVVLDRFIKLSYEHKRNMGLDAHKKVKKEFDRNIVVNKYIEVVK